MIHIEEIFKSLPHRYPMLLVDRILEMEPGKHCIGIKNVSINEPFFQGHYPGKPIMPGVLIVEALAQAGCIMLLSEPQYKGMIPVIGAIDNVKFKRMVVPGDQLQSDVTLEWIRGTIGRLKAIGTVDGELACQMEMTFKLLDRDS
ncbi:MAG: 3-hydroxyacyl-[acyl-carrier-protein] dehydratase FabZ [Armatimonadetes bacterium 55-13]|nr:3-hydroxyacyl-ACP dehydratase FabZ [Armatimonadota bacterium]OJU64713.1 MAG: 3-hydroxyacyl-[acyl-carrier-protein] dehydratase FabZ [Armatimonadetes bacterium 55-13]